MTQYLFTGETQTNILEGILSVVTEDISIILNEKNRNLMYGEGLVDGEEFQITMSLNEYDEGARVYVEVDSSRLDGKRISDIKLMP